MESSSDMEDKGERMQAHDLIQRVAEYDEVLARDLQKFIGARKLGLVYEESKPEYVRLTSKPVVVGDLVNVLPPRGVMEDLSDDHDEHDVIWRVAGIEGDEAALLNLSTGEREAVKVDDLVSIARFDQPIYCGLTETGRVERGDEEDPYHVVINGENYHALESLLYSYRGKVDCIYIDPPYNTGAKDWKYNNNYVGGDDAYRHSKWLTFMEDRLRLAKLLLNSEESVLICTIDEKEYLRLGLLLEQMFPGSAIQMVTTVINPAGAIRAGGFSRVEEHIFFVSQGTAQVVPQQRTMLDEVIRKESDRDVSWIGLRRREPSSIRSARPNQFYPIFVDEKDGVISSIGDAVPFGVPRNTINVPVGKIALWPLNSKGDETLWGLTPDVLRANWKKGYVRIGKWNPKKETGTVQYLAGGTINDVESGKAEITGHSSDGSIIARYHEVGSVPPKRVWNQKSHNAETYGTLLIKALIGKRFSYPKSLYAVEDAMRFYIVNKPNSIILDFFAGSGTTAHAVMRLNHQDGGHRQSISVTNNEVSADEAQEMTKRSLRPGDDDWEKFGIARYITEPRIAAAISGKTPGGDPIKGDYKFTDEFPMSEGFKENAVFYDLTYLEPSVVSADLAFDEIAPLLWMRAGSHGPIIKHGDMYQVTDHYGVLFDYAYAATFTRECHERDVDHIFVVTDIDANYRHMCSEFRGKDVTQLYKSYLRSFEIGADR